MSGSGHATFADHAAFLEQAVRLATQSIEHGGGPFGALVVQAGAVIATGINRVTLEHDPTAHAEIVALRAAARFLATPKLTGCILYCSCEPCPMCLGAILWARLDAAYYAADRRAAAAAGFDDERFYSTLAGGPNLTTTRLVPLRIPTAAAPFEAWLAKADRIPY
jgi:guanine deaminase